MFIIVYIFVIFFFFIYLMFCSDVLRFFFIINVSSSESLKHWQVQSLGDQTLEGPACRQPREELALTNFGRSRQQLGWGGDILFLEGKRS